MNVCSIQYDPVLSERMFSLLDPEPGEQMFDYRADILEVIHIYFVYNFLYFVYNFA